jgi:hypothetical protein
MKDFEKYSKTDFLTKDFPTNSVLHSLQSIALDTSMENMDSSLLDNTKITKN